MKKIFVYGSLREGSFNYKKVLEGNVLNKVYGKATGNLFHLENKGYPALIEGNKQIIGEIITLKNKNILKEIDLLENYNAFKYKESEYIRKPIKVVNLNTKKIEILDAYVYNVNNKSNFRDVLKIVPSGDWLEYIEGK